MYHSSYSHGPPPYYSSAYESYGSPQASPMPHGYYSPRYTATPSPRASPSKHQRRATQDYATSYTTPRMSSYQYAQYSSPGYASQPRKPDHVSDSDRIRSKTRRFEVPVDGRGGGGARTRTRSKSGTYQTSRSYFVYPEDCHGRDRDDACYSSEESLPLYEEGYSSRKTPPPPYSTEYQRHRDAQADYYAYYHQNPSYARDEYPSARSSRPRRASYTTKPQPQPTTQAKRPTTPKAAPRATDADARRAGIPAGYSFKNWDPSEEAILLLGSVFDANSLGKWIYDWTVAWRGPATPMSEIAGDLWLLLIQLASKIKRAEEGLDSGRVRKEEHRDMLDDFLESGERLWQRFNKLLKVCEQYMVKAAQKDTRSGKPMQMGAKSGYEFVDSIFGRDRELEHTEKLMTGIRLWSMRFDANCEDILRKA